MGAYEHISKMFRNGIRNKAEEFGYSNENLCILDGDIEKLKIEHPRCYANLVSCVHNRDGRKPIEYARDMVASWIFEDTMVQALNSRGLVTYLSGTDKNREILQHCGVSSCSDCVVSFEGKNRRLEIMSDYTGWWERMLSLELRDSKFQNLKREKALFLGVCTVSRKYVLLDFRSEVDAEFIPSYKPYGGKPAYSLKLKGSELKKLQVPILVDEIKNRLSVS